MHWTLTIGLLGTLASSVAGEAPKPAPSVTPLRQDNRLVCSLIVLMADRNLDPGIGGTAASDVDPGMARPSGCRPTELRHMSPGGPSDRPTR
jgi:hypothetical protein